MRQVQLALSAILIAAALAISLSMAAEKSPKKQAAEGVDYVKHIKPILAKHCIKCHGPEMQESGLRLDTAAGILQGGDRGSSIESGKSKESLLYQVLVSEGEEDVEAMPLEGEKLSDKKIGLIKRWIDDGADLPEKEKSTAKLKGSDHWSFQAVKRPAPPRVKMSEWVRQPLDCFVLARLEKEGLKPTKQADPATLIRRLSLDLRGVPPTWEEVQDFLLDESPEAYDRLVDRYLASPQYGERWGRYWLDVARYADSNGFTIDGPRSIWLYRDWVIDALNADLPFDEFTVKQLAGDLLPDATQQDIIATGFHRNTLINQEGGTDQEQFRVDAVADRVDTTGSVWLGMTVACARCHQHKFDPISQRDYYEMFAVFNNQDEPNIRVPSPEQSAGLARLGEEIKAAEAPLKQRDAEFLKGLPAWENMLASQAAGEVKWSVLDPTELKTVKGSVLATQDDKSIFVDFSGPDADTFVVTASSPAETVTAVRLEALTHNSLPNKGPGRASNGNFVLTEFELFQHAGKEEKQIKLADAVADHSQENFPVTDAINGDLAKSGWAINVKKGKLNVNREAVFFPADPIDSSVGPLVVKLHQNSGNKYTLGLFRLSVTTTPADALKVPDAIRKIVAKPADKRTDGEREQLKTAYQATDAARKPLAEKVAALKRRRDALNKAVPTTMVLRERKTPRKTHIHIRGDFLRHGTEVQPAAPSVLPPMQVDETRQPTRLDFAKWLVSQQNPLTARVTVNRIWQRFFGLGIVETENDFGTQAIPPTHPELLDWLADDLVRREWSLKSFHRMIVTSATYRQSSEATDELLARDPRNRLLARQTRMRLPAEAIRDVCLESCGLMSRKMKGPGVHPPQPAGIYVLTQQKKPWPVDQGVDRYRRGMYTYFWRSSPYPMLVTFDAADANTTCTRRPRSNTPLQALTMANDEAFVEMAQGLARRILANAADYPEARLRYAYHVCLSREPSPRELEVLSDYVNRQQKHFEQDAEAAKEIAAESLPKSIPKYEAAAWTAVARVIVNLDEFITRE